MRGLILQLAKLDSEAEAQVRIVDFFDSLLRSHATLENVLRATAGLSGVPVGVTMSSSGEAIGFDAQGHRLDFVEPPRPSMERLIISGGREVARAWILDPDEPDRTVDLVMERLVLTCEVLWDSDELGAEARAIEQLLDPSSTSRVREQTATLLRRSLPERVHGICVAPRGQASREWYRGVEAELSRQLGVRRQYLLTSRRDGKLWMVVEPQAVVTLTPPPDSVIGIGHEVALEEAYRSAQFAEAALNFAHRANPTETRVLYDEIGPAALLGLEKNKLLKAEPFMRAVHELLNQDPSHFDILMAMATEASIRGAAKVLHRHHSSVASRIDRAEAITGLDLRNPQNAFTLRLALASWRPPARD